MAEPSHESPDAVVVKNEAASRYEIFLGEQRVGLANYLTRADPAATTIVITHTETSPAFQGRGLAGQLVRFALEDIAAAGHQLAPACSYVADYVARHPEYRSLLA